MPKQYEAMRDKFAKGAKPGSAAYKAAQSKAARIYNAKHKSAPVTAGKYEASKKKKKGRKGGLAKMLIGKFT
jgi:hypothetical protein